MLRTTLPALLAILQLPVALLALLVLPGSVRLFTGFHETPGPIIEDLDEDVEIRDLTAYDSFGACNMFSQVSPEYSTECLTWTTLQRLRVFTQRVAAMLTCLI